MSVVERVEGWVVDSITHHYPGSKKGKKKGGEWWDRSSSQHFSYHRHNPIINPKFH